MTLQMNKVNKKQVSDDKERRHPNFESYQSLGLKHRFAQPLFLRTCDFRDTLLLFDKHYKKTSIDCNQQNAISRNFLYVPRPIFDSFFSKFTYGGLVMF